MIRLETNSSKITYNRYSRFLSGALLALSFGFTTPFGPIQFGKADDGEVSPVVTGGVGATASGGGSVYLSSVAHLKNAVKAEGRVERLREIEIYINEAVRNVEVQRASAQRIADLNSGNNPQVQEAITAQLGQNHRASLDIEEQLQTSFRRNIQEVLEDSSLNLKAQNLKDLAFETKVLGEQQAQLASNSRQAGAKLRGYALRTFSVLLGELVGVAIYKVLEAAPKSD